MTATILVTGATGFIGGRLAARLAADGFDVRCLVRDRTTNRARALELEGFDLHEGTLSTPARSEGPGTGSMSPTT